jgi:hypothetical protein
VTSGDEIPRSILVAGGVIGQILAHGARPQLGSQLQRVMVTHIEDQRENLLVKGWT